jgi:predicted permease
LGVGANTAIFTLVNQVLLRLLPVHNPHELVLLRPQGAHYGSNRGAGSLSYPLYKAIRDQNPVFDGVFCSHRFSAQVGYQGRTERTSAELVSGNYFDVLGVAVALGRPITPDDDRTPGGHPVAVLAHSYWRNRFHSDPGVVGKTIVVNGHTLTIIGVSADGFHGLDVGNSVPIRIPIMMKPQMTPQWNDLDNRRSRWVYIYGRLKPGITREKAAAWLQPFYRNILEMEVKEPDFRNTTPLTRQRFTQGTLQMLPGSQGRSGMRDALRLPLTVLSAIVAVVLLIACANLANLLLARATAREREIAVRLALGASRARLVRHLMAESGLLAVAGGALGLVCAYATGRIMLSFAPDDTPIQLTAAPDLRVLAFNFALALTAALVFGLVPALKATRPQIGPVLKDQSLSSTSGTVHARFRKSLVVAQGALSLLLLISAGLFVQSLRNLRNLSPGLRAGDLISFSVDAPLNGYTSDAAKVLYKRLVERLAGLPGTQRVSAATLPILTGSDWSSTITVEGYQAKPGESMNPNFNAVGPAYFATLGIPLLAGREFDDHDEQMGQGPPERNWIRSAIVNQKFVKRFFADGVAVGKRIGFGRDPGTPTPIEIVGVAADTKYSNMREEIPIQVYIPYREERRAVSLTYYLRTTQAPDQAAGAIRQTVASMDQNLPVFDMRTMEATVKLNLTLERFVASLSSGFGLLATALALVGLYGVMAYMVARRTREIGIRVALGAAQRGILWLVMREVLLLIGIGLAIGLPAALGLTRFARAQLFGLTPADPLTLTLATLALASVAALAGYLPARRASLVEPVRALRYE